PQTSPLSLHDALPISDRCQPCDDIGFQLFAHLGAERCRGVQKVLYCSDLFVSSGRGPCRGHSMAGQWFITMGRPAAVTRSYACRSEEHTSELQSRENL